MPITSNPCATGCARLADEARTGNPRTLANLDIDQAIAFYLDQQADQAAIGFIDALEKAYQQLGRYPQSGSPRYAHELNIPGLRSWPIDGYPYTIFYVDCTSHVDIWRVLHGRRDIPAWLQDPV